MKNLRGMRKQAGVALVLSVVLLLIMTIVGVALVAGAVLQERMSTNQRLQTIAFEAASAGVATALDWGFELDADGNYANWLADKQTCRDTGNLLTDVWEGDWSTPFAFADPEWRAAYRLRVVCREDKPFLVEAGFEAVDESVPPQLFVLSDGLVRDADRIIARRQIEVRIENRAGQDGNTDSAIRMEGDNIAFSPATSQMFLVDGGGGSAIATTLEGDADDIEEEIRNAGSGRLGNYPGGIEAGVGQYPFDSPESLADFVAQIRDALQAVDGESCGNFVPGDAKGAGAGGGGGGSPTCSDDGATNFADLALPFSGNNLTYVAGDAIIGPNLEGSGLLIVEGRVCMSGRADFKGQIISLGGLFEMYGAGNGRTEGSIFVADVNLESPDGWGDTTVDVSGGGNHRISYTCDRVESALDLALQCGVGSLPPRCDEDGNRLLGVGERLRMIGWRESLGWREDFSE